MKAEIDFFLIDKEHLKGQRTFPFQLFVMNPIHKRFTLFLNANRPMSKDLESFLDFLVTKGGFLAVLRKQKKTFLKAQEYEEHEIPTLKKRELHEIEKEQIMYSKLKEIWVEKHGAFSFLTEFEKAAKSDNFDKIIEYARVEILAFSVNRNSTNTFAVELAKEFLIRDHFINRIVATSFFIAKNLNILDEDSLSDIVTGSYLIHLANTQMSLSISRKAQQAYFDSEKKFYQKHPLLAFHLLKRSQLVVSDRVKRIINEHHERNGGRGFPMEKAGDAIEPLALLIGGVAHLFEFSSGKVNGSKQSLRSVIFHIKNRSIMPGLEFDFGDTIYNTITTLIDTEKKEEDNLNIAA